MATFEGSHGVRVIDGTSRRGWIQSLGEDQASLWRSLVAGVLTCVLFALNALTPAEIQFGFLFVLVPLIATGGRHWRGLWFWTGVALVSTIGSYLLIVGSGAGLTALANLTIALIAISATALLLSRQAQAQRAIDRQSQALDVAGSAIVVRDHANQVVVWNQAAEALFGWSAGEAIGRDLPGLLQTRLTIEEREIVETIARDGVWEGEIQHLRKNGEPITVFTRWTQQLERASQTPFIVEASVDAHTQRAAEALRLSELRYRTIFDTLAFAILEHDMRALRETLDGLRDQGVADLSPYLAAHPDFVDQARRRVPIVGANETATRMLGLAPLEQAVTLADVLTEDDGTFARFLAAMHAGASTFEAETRIRIASGETIPVILALSLPPETDMGRVTGCLVDLSDRLKMQAALDRTRTELDHALRAASLGELSASIAHEVNQPLAAVVNFANASLRWMRPERPDVDEARAALQSAIEAAQVASDVVKRIRKLLGKLAPDKVPVSIDDVVNGAIKLIHNEALAYDATIEKDLRAAGATVMGDAVLLQQVLINVLVNAVQAMEAVEGRPRVVAVRTRKAAGAVRIEIADSGPGFTPEAQDRAFETFYTTKAKGIGLGLAICRSTIEAHEGSITIAPGPEHGAVVGVQLPLAS